jgi:hypothetical protein
MITLPPPLLPMDDIDYLKANALKRQMVLHIDSIRRDRSLYPNNNNYVIRFATPVKNVFAVEVLQASIPRTHYTIEDHNNAFVFVYEAEAEAYDIRIPVGDYNIVQFVETINTLLDGKIVFEYLSDPPTLLKKFLIRSKVPFSINLQDSTVKELIGIDNAKPPTLDAGDDRRYYKTYDVVNSRVLNPSTVTVNVQSKDIILYQTFVPTTNTGYVDEVEIPILNRGDAFHMKISVLSHSLDTLGEGVVSVDTGSDAVMISFFTQDKEILLEPDETYFVKMNVFDTIFEGSIIDYDYYSNDNTYDGGDRPPLYTHINNGTSFAIPSNTPSIYLHYRLSVKQKQYAIVPTGIYNFTGDRYITLRCKEVDKQVVSIQPLNKQYESGLAQFRLGLVGYEHVDYGFTKLPIIEFHPIGKLDALTMRFERADGTLYDFKGVNHNMTLKVHYYDMLMSHDERYKINLLNPNMNVS